MHVLRVVGWVAAVVYSTIPTLWLIVHPRARRLGRAREPLTIVGPIWFGLWLAMGAITWPARHVTLYSTAWAWAAAVPLFVAGAAVYRRSFGEFTFNQILGRSEFHPDKHEQKLVTAGIRRRVRHPIYLAHLLELLGWSLGTGVTVIYAMTAFAIVTGAFMIRLEDRELEERFGDEFRDYRARVPSILPRF
jgi:protein-S-isoprenylcysteine O-methyltransferase Ste14